VRPSAAFGTEEKEKQGWARAASRWPAGEEKNGGEGVSGGSTSSGEEKGGSGVGTAWREGTREREGGLGIAEDSSGDRHRPLTSGRGWR
jgi:hypothetical protein